MNEIAQPSTSSTGWKAALNLSRFAPGARTRACLIFAAAFALAASALSLTLRAISPDPEIDMLSDKVRILIEEPNTYDTVFLGTSRTLYHVIPAEVEAAASQAGCPAINVYNMGVYGLTGSEQDWILDKILTNRPDTLQRIIIEPPLPEFRHLHEITTSRSRFFHGPENHAAALDSIQSYGESTPKRLYRAGIYALGVAYDLSGVGRAAARFFPPAEEPADYLSFSMAEHGFEALDEVTSEGIEARRQEFLANPEKIDAQLGLYGNPSPNIDARADYMVDKIRRIEAAGLQPSLFISPDFMELDRTPQTGEAAARQMPGLSLLNFNRPDAHPDLFAPNLWHDFSHFNRKGATALSRALGADLCASMTAQTQTDHQYAVR